MGADVIQNEFVNHIVNIYKTNCISDSDWNIQSHNWCPHFVLVVCIRWWNFSNLVQVSTAPLKNYKFAGHDLVQMTARMITWFIISFSSQQIQGSYIDWRPWPQLYKSSVSSWSASASSTSFSSSSSGASGSTPYKNVTRLSLRIHD